MTHRRLCCCGGGPGGPGACEFGPCSRLVLTWSQWNNGSFPYDTRILEEVVEFIGYWNSDQVSGALFEVEPPGGVPLTAMQHRFYGSARRQTFAPDGTPGPFTYAEAGISIYRFENLNPLTLYHSQQSLQDRYLYQTALWNGGAPPYSGGGIPSAFPGSIRLTGIPPGSEQFGQAGDLGVSDCDAIFIEQFAKQFNAPNLDDRTWRRNLWVGSVTTENTPGGQPGEATTEWPPPAPAGC